MIVEPHTQENAQVVDAKRRSRRRLPAEIAPELDAHPEADSTRQRLMDEYIESLSAAAAADLTDADSLPKRPLPPPLEDRDKPGKIGIRIGLDEDRVVREAMDALAEDPELYQRGTNLVYVIDEPEQKKVRLIQREASAPRIANVPEPWVRTRLAAVVDWLVLVPPKNGKPAILVPVRGPSWAIRSVATAGAWPRVRVLTGFTEVPILRADGSILDNPGFDEATGLIYRPLGRPLAIPPHPSHAGARAACERVLAVVSDFPFEKPQHKAAWLALLLTPLCRWAFDGPTPLFLVDANIRGAGKSFLARATMLLALGRIPPTMTLPADEEERRKRITALAIAGDSAALLDNVEGVLGGATLNAALTSTTWADRILGVSKTTGTLPLYAVWIATGNNAVLGADTARRTIHIRLQSDLEKPEEREGFAQPDLLGWIRAERHRLLADALTICRAYFEAGRPDMKLGSMGSYEGWSLVRQIVVWAGAPDPLATQVFLAETGDREAAELRGLMAGLETAAADAGEPVTAAALLKFAAQPDGSALKEILDEHLPARKGELPTPARLSGRLRHFKGRPAGGKAIDSASGGGGVARWLVRPLKGGVSGVSGDSGVHTANARARGDGDEKSNAAGTTQPTPPTQPTVRLREPGEDDDDLLLDLAGGAPCGR